MMEERGFGRATTMTETVKKHSVSIDSREKISISGVEDVESFDEETIVVYTSMGTLTLKGGEFRISKLNVDNGEMIVEGEMDSITYSDEHAHDKAGGFFGKLFK